MTAEAGHETEGSVYAPPGILPWDRALTGSIQSFPMLQRNGQPYAEGVPQAANLTRHRQLIEGMIEEWIPDENWSGIGVFDYGAPTSFNLMIGSTD